MKSTIFQGFEVLAAMKEQKTRFSVRLKNQPTKDYFEHPAFHIGDGHSGNGVYVYEEEYPSEGSIYFGPTPFKVGDKLFVKETWFLGFAKNKYSKGIIYKADKKLSIGKWKSAAIMPQWASRLTIEVTGVRVGRVQHETYDEIISMGISCPFPPEVYCEKGYRDHFKEYWISKHGQQSWDNNDWIFAFDFKVVK